MLVPVRQYAAEKLMNREGKITHDRHLAYYTGLAEQVWHWLHT
jgi:hypothetical protein